MTKRLPSFKVMAEYVSPLIQVRPFRKIQRELQNKALRPKNDPLQRRLGYYIGLCPSVPKGDWTLTDNNPIQNVNLAGVLPLSADRFSLAPSNPPSLGGNLT